MGFYIEKDSKDNPLPHKGKADAIIADGAIEVPGHEFVPHMVCVLVNPDYEVCGFAYNKGEFNRFKYDGSNRPRRWFQYPTGTKYFEERYPELLDMDRSAQDNRSELEQVSDHLRRRLMTPDGDPGFTILPID